MEEKQEKRFEMDMCSGPIMKKMLMFAIPLVCSSVLQLLFNAADIVVVGRFAGDNSLAAVGSNTALINLLTNLFIGLSVGVNVLTGLCYGAKQEKELTETVHTAMLFEYIQRFVFTGGRNFERPGASRMDAGAGGSHRAGDALSSNLFCRYAGGDDL